MLDDNGFVLIGLHLTHEHLRNAGCPFWRTARLLETSILGDFAAGDVRSGNVKRVASGLGEGALAITFVRSSAKRVIKCGRIAPDGSSRPWEGSHAPLNRGALSLMYLTRQIPLGARVRKLQFSNNVDLGARPQYSRGQE